MYTGFSWMKVKRFENRLPYYLPCPHPTLRFEKIGNEKTPAKGAIYYWSSHTQFLPRPVSGSATDCIPKFIRNKLCWVRNLHKCSRCGIWSRWIHSHPQIYYWYEHQNTNNYLKLYWFHFHWCEWCFGHFSYQYIFSHWSIWFKRRLISTTIQFDE